MLDERKQFRSVEMLRVEDTMGQIVDALHLHYMAQVDIKAI